MTAPDLTEARDLAAMWQARAEAAEAIIRGRDVAPTMAETAAHIAAGGTFRVVVGSRAYVASTETGIDLAAQDMPGARWWAYDAAGRPCAWPVAP